MEQLRMIPVFMFLAGITLVYAGFTNQRPLDIIRNNLGGLSNTTAGAPTTVPFTESADPNYVGTSGAAVYYRPTMPGPRLLSG